MFQVGDKIKIKRGCSGTIGGEVCTLQYGSKSGGDTGRLFAWGRDISANCSCQDNWELVSSEINNNQKNIMQNLKDKFNNLFVKEPQKSLRELGITDNNDNLTEDGKAIYLDWKFKKDLPEFVKEVVEPLKEAEEAKKDNENTTP